MIITSMKKYTLAFIAVLFTLFTTSAQQPADSTKAFLGNLLDQWHHDAEQCNLEAYIGAMGDNAVFIGTDATERWTRDEFRDFCRPHFDLKKSWNFKSIERNIYTDRGGNFAWFDELLDTQLGLCRGSGVIRKTNKGWKIEQYVLSATVPNSQMRMVTRNKGKEDTTMIMGKIFDRYGMTGTIMIVDDKTKSVRGYNPDRWDSGYLPASTFKIPNSLIGLETGVIDTNYVFKWNGEKRRLPQWEADLKLKDAFRVSCVPCYQEVARKIGAVRMKDFLARMHYAGMDVHEDNIDRFWLEGNSRITPRQQVEFLQNLYHEKLPLKTSTMRSVREIMVNEKTPDYTLSGKTGWAIRNGNNYGWFVGWIETSGNVFFIATLVEPKNQEKVDDFAIARKTITMDVLKFLGITGPSRND
jgi:beta-lactamase class D